MFANPIGLIALLAVPAVLALHLYRRRFEPREVSGLFLWRPEDRAPTAGRQRQPLRRSASLVCELLVAALLALAFSGPRSSCAGARGEHLVVVLDSSASMSARSIGAPRERSLESVRDAALAEVRERIEGLPSGSRVTVVRSGRRPGLLAGPGALPQQALGALESWTPAAPRHALSAAANLAAQFSAGSKWILVTDHFEPEPWAPSVELVALGAPRDNWAITHAARTLEAGEDGREQERLFVTVASFAAVERELEVELAADGRELARRATTISAGGRAHLAFAVPEGAGGLVVALPDDALAIDNRAWLAPPVRRRLALHSGLEPAALATLGLAQVGDAPLARWLALVPHSFAALNPSDAHLTLGAAGDERDGAWRIEFAALGEERRDWLGPFLVDRTHPLLDGISLDGAVWSADPHLRMAGAPLISIQDAPLLTEERTVSRTTWRFNLDPARSSLQRTPDWPILLANLAEARRAALPGPERTSLGLGERLLHRPSDEAADSERSQPLRYVLEGPLDAPSSSRRELLVRELLEFDEFESPGWHRLSLEGRSAALLGVSFLDAAESDLRSASAGRRASELDAAWVDERLSWLELSALIGALSLVCLDWWLLAGSRAVAGRSG